MNSNSINPLTFASVKDASPAFLSGGGETGKFIREFDWSKSSLGPISSWPQSLCTTISVCLNSKFPILIWWGPELVMLYNDAYRSIPGDKHPGSLGSAGKKVWPEIWEIIGPMLNGVINEGISTWSEDQLFLLNRHNYIEECYFTFSFSPIYDESGGIGGVFTAVTETTKKVLNDRQLQTLNKLGETITYLINPAEVCKKAIEALAKNQHDFPFALLYETIITSKKANLTSFTDNIIELNIPNAIDLSTSNYLSRMITIALTENKSMIVEKINQLFGQVPKGSWQVSSDKALVLPLPKRDQVGMHGFLIIGLNPYSQLNKTYMSFFSLVADKITTSISNVNAYAEELQRAKALKETNLVKKVLLVDNNSDTRASIGRLLSSKFEVIVACNGQEAFEKTIQNLPDLILSDIIMTKLDGYGFLKKLRSHLDTKNIPVIFLTAKAGEESKIEELEAGLNDYLVKPFSANKLLARIDSSIKISVARRNAEQDLFSFLIQAPIAITILSGPDYIVELANERYLTIVQRTKHAFVGRPIFETVPEILNQGFKEIFDTVRITKEPMSLIEYKTNLFRNGQQETTYLNIVYQPIKKIDGEVYRIMIVVDEVTEQVKARKKVEESEKELNELANAMPQLVWIVDSSAQVIYYNNRVIEFNGSKKVVAGTWWWRGYIHPADLKATENAWKKAFDLAGNFVIEHRLKMKDGNYRWHISRGIPQKEEDGNVIKWFCTSTDINESKERAKTLEQEVKRRTLELNELNISLKQSNIELQQFAHVASHDLKEPLRKIKIFNGRLASDNQSVFSDNSKLYINKIESATSRLFEMIEGVLNYSMLNNAEQTIEDINLNDLLQNIESDLELPIIQKSASIKYDTLPNIQGASILIYQLFYNLINNSLKFSIPGTPLIISISFALIQKSNIELIKILVEDNGIGFEPEYAEKIFNTFTRLNSKDKYEGTGLGLALCNRIVQRHSGTIKAYGNLNKGSIFTILLPVKQILDHL